jgi:opacity protein-like surface antigen
MKKTLTLATLAMLSAAPAMAQWNTTTTPLGNGWNSYNGTGPNGQSYTGTSMPLGNGWTSSTFNDNSGHTTTCTTMPLGNGFASTNCQ